MSHESGYFCIYTLTDGRRLAGLPAETQTLMTISRSVIFDLDGTLLDSVDGDVRSFTDTNCNESVEYTVKAVVD